MKIKSFLAGVCTLLILSPGLSFQAAADWPTFMGDPTRSGSAGLTSEKVNTSELSLAWDMPLHTEVIASPVVKDNQLLIAAENGNLYSIDMETRRLQWLFHSHGGISSTPAIDRDKVYFLNRAGYVYALDLQDGKPLWRFETGGESIFSTYNLYGIDSDDPVPDPWDFFLSSPLVADGRVYVGSSDQRIYALDAETGARLWSFKTGGVVHASPALAGDTLIVGSWDSAIYALDAQTGAERWRFQTEAEQKISIWLGVQSSPVIDGDSVFVGSRDGYLYRLNVSDGKQQWRYDVERSWVVATPAVDEQHVYFGTSDTAAMIAVNKRTGKESYRFNTRVWTYASALRVGNDLVFGTMAGELYALDATTGEQHWRYQTPAHQEDAFGILDEQGRFRRDRLYGETHQLYSAMAHVKRLGAFIASPIWHRGQLIAVTATGQILVFTAEP
ncbi:PQQ-binding-like beta-propeller repeat protein [Marinimicrobium sp. ABcell2]|uniref:outer membrane protein assembly factor BamB family protein n=1 Tax=Marinimicrobium sp. ABcell2 TaxID=3069751 RepID=UPI0027B83649|nr:PQQ-binding-like beta-propeller repeat protein [Marinimicrobium sp. ABcell2]MDQ2075977.1 PQQ-binding-like beta-propeller repeat protein [Marinimicrobium sp. ABcell2]